MNLTVKEMTAIPHLRTLNTVPVAAKKIKEISTDSRQVHAGDVFIALRGENFDGHNFVRETLKNGAICAVVDNKYTPGSGEALLVVDDTVKALGNIARLYRRKFSLPVLAVAGSNGKTTTKEMIAAVLRKKYRVLSSKGNLNNHIGVPQTLFLLKPSHEVAVVETGTNHFGEIGYLCGILEPSHGIVTNIGREHLEFFGDLDGVEKEEGELFRYLGNEGTPLVNQDDSRIARLGKNLKRRITYGFTGSRAAIRGKQIGVTAAGCFTFSVHQKGKKPFSVSLNVPGKHNMENALAAASVGIAFGVPASKISAALGKFSAVSKRMEVSAVAGVTILNDTYNANSDSVITALETLQSMNVKGKKIVVLGDMRELGARSEQEHRRIGRTIGEMGFAHLLTHGSDAKYIYEEALVQQKEYFVTQDELSADLCNLVSTGDAVLIKGSRGMKMENVVVALRNHLESARLQKTRSTSKRVN